MKQTLLALLVPAIFVSCKKKDDASDIKTHHVVYQTFCNSTNCRIEYGLHGSSPQAIVRDNVSGYLTYSFDYSDVHALSNGSLFLSIQDLNTPASYVKASIYLDDTLVRSEGSATGQIGIHYY